MLVRVVKLHKKIIIICNKNALKKRERSIILLMRKRLPKTGNELFDEKFIE